MLQDAQLVGLLQASAVASNEAPDIQTAATTCLEEIRRVTGWPLGHLYLASRDGRRMEPSGVWSVADPTRFAAFQDVTDHLTLQSGHGLPGRVLESARPQWVIDAPKDANFPRAKVAEQVGLRGAFAFPILSGTSVVGVLEFFASEAVPPDESLLEVFAQVGRQLGRVIERQRAAETLWESEQKFRSVAQAAADAIVIADERGRITFWNAAAERMFGYSGAEIVDEPLTRLMPARFQGPHHAAMSRHTVGQPSRVVGQTIELVGMHRDGHEFPIEVSVARWNVRQQSCFSGIIRDLSERKAAETLAREQEEQLRQSAKMEATGQLAAGVAHDVNNVLTAIYASTHVLGELLPRNSDMLEYVHEIRDAATRAADMTQHLLAFGRRQILQIQAVDLNAEVRQLEKILSRLLPESIQVELRLQDDLPAVPADHAQMQQVILNVAVNARDAMLQGGRLLIETTVVDLDAEYVRQHVGTTIGRRVLLAITDTGVGMDAATQARIFEPYFTTKGRLGTGIGLATVYGIVKQSGGDIRVYSEPRKGTTFKIYLPICDDSVAAPAPRRDASERTLNGSETLVLVENDEPIRRVTARILRGHGYSVLEAASAEEALSIEPAVLKSAAMLITDLVLPARSGRELAEALRGAHPSLRVLYVSGYTENAAVQQGALDPQVDFLPKPFAPTALVQRVRSMLDAPAGQPIA